MTEMTVSIENSGAIREIEALMSRFGLTAGEVVERVMVDAGAWMPLEILAIPLTVEALGD